jgi:ATP-dependent DNA helicase RecQ
MIFSDVALHEMAHHYPTTNSAFMQITGVGEKKLESFGTDFMGAIKRYLDQTAKDSATSL